MNNGFYKLVFSRVRHMMVAVADFAKGQGAQDSNGAQRASVASFQNIGLIFPVRAVAFAAMLMLGTAASVSYAQIVAAPGSGVQVVQTQNGLQQVNIAKPSGAGVSLNNYSQFDVPGKGGRPQKRSATPVSYKVLQCPTKLRISSFNLKNASPSQACDCRM